MQGSRTIIFNLAMLVGGMLGYHLDPTLLGSWLDVYIAAWGVGGILLRVLTTTPVFNTILADAEAEAKKIGIDQTVVDQLATALKSALPTGNILDALTTLGGKVETLLAAKGSMTTAPPAAAVAAAAQPASAAIITESTARATSDLGGGSIGTVAAAATGALGEVEAALTTAGQAATLVQQIEKAV